MLTIDKTQLFAHILEQHVNEAAFLWTMRAQAMTQAHQIPASIRRLEQRINNHLKGVFMQPECAWEYALEAAADKESGEIFTLAMLALHGGEYNKINTALELASDNKETFAGLISALGWLPSNTLYPLLRQWIESDNPAYRHMAIAACSIRRLEPNQHLTALLNHELNNKLNNKLNNENIPLFSRMLRLIGELKRHDLAPLLVQAQQHKNDNILFWAYWSALILGDRSVLQNFERYVLQPGPWQAKAIDLAFRCLEPIHAWHWINALIATPEHTEQTIIALSALGDPHGINWLLTRMEEPRYAQAAGDAFSVITGTDLTQQGLIDTRPTHNENTEDNKAEEDFPTFDGYENLPIPHAEKTNQYWRQIRHRFKAGQRYFMGRPIEPKTLEQTFLAGKQKQRLAAALEFALLNKTHAYPNAKAPLNN